MDSNDTAAIRNTGNPISDVHPVRYFYAGDKASRGKIVYVKRHAPSRTAADYINSGPTIGDGGHVEVGAKNCWWLMSSEVWSALATKGIDLDRFEPNWYNKKLGGYVALVPPVADGSMPDSRIMSYEVPDDVVDVELSERPSYAAAVARARPKVNSDSSYSDAGFFGIGIHRGRRSQSHAVLWRTAHQLGASFIFTIGARHGFVESEDCIAAFKTVPAWRFNAWEDFVTAAPFSTPLVAVEMGGQPLETFQHPKNCVYLLGSEEFGIPASVLASCHFVVSIPCVRAHSYNIAVAGAIVMYDRMVKMQTGVLATSTTAVPTRPPLETIIKQIEETTALQQEAENSSTEHTMPTEPTQEATPKDNIKEKDP
ncbi:tRNA/rRNA methyltransferase, SpoU [Pelomyxa schiedti]|nr:tRNA/rRNA methyltransferase, SpoU [Pelomyxa schiedti]